MAIFPASPIRFSKTKSLFRSTAAMAALAVGLSACGLGNLAHRRLPGAGPNPNDAPVPGVTKADWSGVVIADEPLAAEAGRTILANGGTAADAATAVAFALMVTLPSRASLGGGGGCVAYSPFVKTNGVAQPEAFVFTSPSAATAGSRPAAVPMTARGLLLMQAIYGYTPIQQLIAPAQRMAALGVPVSKTLANDLSVVAGPLLADPSARAVFANAAGQPLQAGETMVQPDLANTLDVLRAQGVANLYQGPFAQSFSQASAQAGGPISQADLDHAVPLEETPLTLHDDRNVLNFLPTDGGVAAAAAYQQMRKDPTNPAGANNAALAVATAYRNGTDQADPQALLKDANLPAGSLPPLAASTSFVTLDGSGAAVACSLTMNNLFGTGRIAPGTGILLAAAPDHGRAPLLAPVLIWNKPTNSFRAAIGATGQEGAPLAAGIAAYNALHDRGRAFGMTVPEPGRINGVNCPDRVPGDFKSCVWVTDPRGTGIAIGHIGKKSN
ncbi:gamma-glutamyltransferase [Acidisoma silvae]|uniref:Gamma-glutamyltransferase n=1 Tax=Acidisoma silvae TaxID=2802396 RepID=A0A963YQG4_9PROT|nr:gamma-glutamyltransferase [Acidisoma silvae]MCB8874749.1 gamma-glutamyltransferase [Acidisoma silvae]